MTATSSSAPGRGIGSFRWVICGLLFLAATLNYVDRQVIGFLKPTLQHEFGWSEMDYADIVFAFQIAYAIGLLFAGRMMDRLGTRLGFSVAIVIWSLAAMAHAEATWFGPGVAAMLASVGLVYSGSVAGFMAARFVLGLGESGNFPAANKAIAEWFPKKERAFAFGLFNSGTNVGALVVPLVVPWITITYGWYWAFVATGAIGFLWLFLWWPLYKSPEHHPRLKPAELAYIQSDPPDPPVKVPWRQIIPHRQAWAFAIAKFLTDPVWWLYLFWIPDFFSRNYGLNLTKIGPPVFLIYLVASVGSVGGGYLSGWLLQRGWSTNAARKTTMLIFALAVMPIVFASKANNLWLATAIVALAAAAHQGWSATLFTLASDMFPRHAVGSVTGFGGMAGAVGGMLIAKLTGKILESTGSYMPVFLIAGSVYLIALVLVQILSPKLEPVKWSGMPSQS
jgi:ACS family hexuronate transporter-like MFS transporter